MTKKLFTALLIILTICTVLTVTACKSSNNAIMPPGTPPDPGASNVGGQPPPPSAQATLYTWLKTDSWPLLQTARQISKGMSYTDVLDLMGLPADVIPGEFEPDVWFTWSNIWLLADADGFIKVTYYSEVGPNKPVTVTEIVFDQSKMAGGSAGSRKVAIGAGETELVVTSYEQVVYRDWLGVSTEFNRVHCELVNPNPFGIMLDYDAAFYFGDERLSSEDCYFEGLWNLTALSGLANPGSLRLNRPIENGDVLTISGELINSEFYRVVGTAEFILHFGGGSATVESNVVMYTEMYDNAGSNVSFTPVSYIQEDDYVWVFVEMENSNPFNVRTADMTVYYNGEAVQRLDWSTRGAHAGAYSSVETDLRVYRTAESGDRIIVRGYIADIHSSLDTFEYEIVFP